MNNTQGHNYLLCIQAHNPPCHNQFENPDENPLAGCDKSGGGAVLNFFFRSPFRVVSNVINV
jgi:hypothetical protein